MKRRKSLTKEIVEMKASGMTYAAIAEKLGVSRQRIQQYFMPTIDTMHAISERTNAHCEVCGQFDQFGHYHHLKYDYEIINEPSNIQYLCTSCHSKERGEKRYCLNCGKRLLRQKNYCSKACRRAHLSLPVTCSNCGEIFILSPESKARVRMSKTGLLFCSKKCQGTYLGIHHTPNPNHHKKSKYAPLFPEIIMRLNHGENLYSIIRHYNIPIGNHAKIKSLLNAYRENS